MFLKYLFILSFSCIVYPHFDWQQKQQWHWENIPHAWQDLNLSKDFKFGVASSAFHLEGRARDNGGFIDNNFTASPRCKIASDYKACNHWDMWQEDVQHIKNAAFSQYRLSIGMDRIMPQKGIFDEETITHYKKLIKELKHNGIEPWICLHHFKHPVWFEHDGGFLNQENIKYFEQFCEKVFTEFNQDVTYWATFNEPLAYAIESYLTGKYPPHYPTNWIKQAYGFILAGKVLKNMLEAHVHVYQTCKKINPETQIGIIHMFHIIHPHAGNKLEQFVSTQANQLINDTTLDFFKTGAFNWKNLVWHTNAQARNSLDFIGANYYRNQYAKFDGIKDKQGIINARTDQETTTDNGWAIHPEGLYCSIKKAAELNLPIHITEIGIADKTETQQDTFLRKHIYAIKKAIDEGIDVRSCFIWTLMEQPKYPAFGVYKIDAQTWKRSLRPGFATFVNYLYKHKTK